MDHIYIYYVDEYNKTVEFEIQGYPEYEHIYEDTLCFEEFYNFFIDFAHSAHAYRVHIDKEDSDKLQDYFGFDILQ